MSRPLLYQINTRCWLRELSERAGEPVTFGNVPATEIERWSQLGLTHIWLMGVWMIGPRGRAHSLAQPSLRQFYSEVLPDWQDADVAGSPYAIADYTVAPTLGGENGLRQFRERLNAQGIKLLLDFVPNHLGLDHAWVHDRPELFVQNRTGWPEGFRRKTKNGSVWFAYGKDPYFPAWRDTIQLDYRNTATHSAMRQLLHGIAERCDGVRCDMAMLLLNRIFFETWKPFPKRVQDCSEEFWSEVIPSIKSRFPEFLFLAECYWDLEEALQKCGFDYTYHKRLYDHVVSRDPGRIHDHVLGLPRGVLERSAHFLENHDEPRIASRLSLEEHRAAALLILTLPGMPFLHEGQLAGARAVASVHLGRRLAEGPDASVVALYETLLTILKDSAVGRGASELLQPRAAWDGNPTARNFVIVQWQARPGEFELSVVNFAPHRSQCYVDLRVPELTNSDWRMRDLLGTEVYDRSGNELHQRGLYLDLPAYGAQLFRFRSFS